MKPLTLSMSAFGAYADPVIIDFTLFGSSTLFLITGPTGSGKSTILDAVCFALYGDTSGDERSGRQMRSDHCVPGTVMQVRFDFLLGRDSYRVYRRMESEQAGKTGKSVTRVTISASLWKRTSDDNSDGQLLTEGSQKVTDKIEELFGFKSDQFRQVIMIPQGQFRKLLLANSSERESILENLFRTEIYGKIQDALKTNAAEAGEKLGMIDRRKIDILSAAGCTAVQDLQDEYTRLETEGHAIEEACRDLLEEEKRLRENLSDAVKTAALFEELKNASSGLENLLQIKKEIDAKVSIQMSAEKALSLEDSRTALEERRKERQASGDVLTAVTSATAEADRALRQAHEAYEAAQARAEDLPRLREELSALGFFPEKLEKFGETNAAVLRTQEEREQTGKTLENLKNRKQNITLKLAQLRETLAETGKTAAGAEQLRTAVEALSRKIELERRILETETALSRLENTVRELRLQEEHTALELFEEKNRLTVQRIRRLSGQAAILARSLKKGTPCPVCGSTEHPEPAQEMEGIPDELELETSEKTVEALEKKLEGVRISREEADRLHAGRLSEHTGLKESLRDIKNGYPENDPEKLPEMKLELQKTLDAAGRLEKLHAETADLEVTLRHIGDEYSETSQRVGSIEGKLAGLTALKIERESEIPVEYRDPRTLSAGIQRLEREIEQREHHLDKTRSAVSDASQKAAALEAQLEALKTRAAEAERNFKNQEEAFFRKMNSAGFSDTHEYERACLPRNELERLAAETAAYREKLNSAADRKTRAETATTGLIEPDLHAIRNLVEEARTASIERQRTGERNLNRVNEIGRMLAELRRLETEYSEYEKEFRIIESLNEVSSGKAGMRIPFQRFVLGTLLDDVLTSATMRLRIMSRGRFSLERQSRTDDLRRAAGLDLAVYDSYTGSERSAATLSGGESFLAALSLALGMADVVQSYTGGIRLDTMFIDEGFGSLDPEALDAAMQALSDLQKTGRLIGIISHVPELKERIDTRLEVSSGRNGSRVTQVLP